MKNLVNIKYFWAFLIIGVCCFYFKIFSNNKSTQYKIKCLGAKIVEYDLKEGRNEIHVWVGFEIINLSNKSLLMEYSNSERKAFITVDDSTFYKILLPQRLELKPYENLKGEYFVPSPIQEFVVNKDNSFKVKSKIKQIKKQVESKSSVYYYDLKNGIYNESHKNK